MAKIELKTKVDADFIMETMSVFEKFEHQGKKYLPYLNTEQKGDEAAVYEKIIIPLFTDVLNYDKHKDFYPQATLSTGKVDNWIRNREGSPLIALEALRSNASQAEFIEHRQRLLFGYFDELGVKYAVLTNGVVFEVWNRIAEKSKGLFVTIDFREIYIKFIGKGIKAFVDEDCRKFSNLMTLKKENQYLDVEHIYPEPQLDISEELHFNNFLSALQERMEEVKEDVLAKFEYLKREYQECSELIKQYKEQTFLKNRKRYERAQKFIQSFETWQKTSPANTSLETFCLETMYVFFNRILLIRICEDKGIIQRKISNGGIKKYIEYRGYIKFSQVDYKALLKEAYQIMDRFYPHLFQIDIFDWYEIDNDIFLRVLFTFNPYNFNKVDRDILGKLYEKYLDREERKRLGEFYTPEEVIDYILDSVGYTRESEIEGKKLLDPACGSGGFLVRATNIFVEKLKNHGFDAETILRKLQESIYGFDINSFACHLTETNLFFQVIDIIQKAKENNPNFVMDRFNIYQTDSLRIPEEKEELKLFPGERTDYLIDAEIVKRIKVKQDEFKDGFDFVVGNPPYGDTLDSESKKIISKKYPFVADYEISEYFIALGMELLKDKSHLGYIVPNTLILNINANKFRQHLLDSSCVSQIVDLSKISVFLDPKVRNIILLLRIETNAMIRNESEVKALFCEEFKRHSLVAKLYNTKKLSLLKDNDKEWLYLFRFKANIANIIKKIESDVEKLGKITQVSQGLIPYDKYRGHSPETIKNRIWHAQYKKDESYKKELRGGDVKRYYLKWNGIQWISYGNWLAAPRKPEFFTSPRVLIREITDEKYGKVNATFSDEEYYNNPSIINIINNLAKKYNLKYILAIINSTLFAFYHLNTSPKAKKGLFPKILVNDVKSIPIKPAWPKVQKEFANLVDQILEINKDIPSLEAKVNNTQELLKDFDFILGDLADIPGIRVELRDRIGKSRIKREGLKVFLDSKSYIECKSEHIANYIELYLGSLGDTLRGKTNSEVVDLIRIPKSPAQLQNILQKRQELLNQIEELKHHQDEIDREIDERVYKLYGLTEEEIKIVKRSD